jgi:CHAT domain-containing protein
MLRSGEEPLRLKYSLSPAGIPEIQKKLRNNGQTLLQYAVTGRHVFIFVLNGSRLVVHRLSVGVLQEVNVLKQLHNISPEKFSTAAFRLYEALIRPVEKNFVSDKLIIIPDGELFSLNFELLLSDHTGRDFSKMKYLLYRYEISYQLTATAAVQARAKRNAEKKAMLLAPVFTDAMKKAYLESIGDSSLADRQYFSLLRQPFAIRAAKQIGKYIQNDLFAEQAAVESVFKQAAERYHVLHLGTHAEVNNAAPLQSRFFLAKQLSDDSTAGNDDGYLHAYEIYGMQLQSDLAVLTACETGVGNWSQGEGVMSLAHSFIYAGCPSVIMSLWKIDEKASADIIAAFYKYLSAGKTKSEALRLAKLQHIQASESISSHPYFWAGMTLMGSEDPVYASSLTGTWLWALGVLLLAVPSWYFLSRKKR